jgi:tetratricopeptide (TPR) repeat protein
LHLQIRNREKGGAASAAPRRSKAMKLFGYALIAMGLAGVTVVGEALLPLSDPSYPDPAALPVAVSSGDSISLFEQRVAANPNPIDRTWLAQFYATRSRETGDLADLGRAELLLKEAIAEQPNYAPAVSTLAYIYLAEHRFEEALDTARRAHDLNARLGAMALVGDVLVATGDYQGATEAYAEAVSITGGPGLSSRLAHLDELHGEVQTAITTMELAAAAHLRAGGSGEEAAWYQARLGDLNFTIGQLAEADRRYRAALDVFPGYYIGLAGRARVAAARRDFEGAIDLYEQAITVIPRPELLVAVGDLYAVTGQTQNAAKRYNTVEAIARLASGIYDRNLALFYADRGRADEALRLAEEGLEVRHDIFGYDTQAWALYRLGRLSEAREAIDQALTLGTRDPVLLFHAGSISLALGEKDRAVSELEAALGLNRYFHPIFAPEAEAMLKEARG